MSTDAPAVEPGFGEESLGRRVLDNIRGGNLGSWPVLIGLVVIVVFFSFKADNFLSPGNFSNILTQMAGVTLLAYGVVFVLLIGEIDLSISYISGIAGVVVAKLTIPDGNEVAGIVAIVLAVAVCALIGAFQGSFVAFIGVPAFVVTLAGYQIWQGAIQKSIEAEGVIVIQDTTVNNTANYFFSERAGWILTAVVLGVYVASLVSTFVSHRRHGVAVRDPWLIVVKAVAVVAVAIVVVVISNRDRGVPFVLLLMIASLLILTFVAKRTTFGRHVYAVGGNAEAARRAGINVDRIKIAVFAICSLMAALGGIILASRLRSVDTNAGGGSILLYSIAAAVIGGTSLFGGRGHVKSALLGALVIVSIDNGLGLLGLGSGQKFVITGGVLLLAVSVDSISRRGREQRGRA